MLSYKDRTYCMFFTTCKLGKTCDRALTSEILEEANNFGLPTCQFTDYPECWENICK